MGCVLLCKKSGGGWGKPRFQRLWRTERVKLLYVNFFLLGGRFNTSLYSFIRLTISCCQKYFCCSLSKCYKSLIKMQKFQFWYFIYGQTNQQLYIGQTNQQLSSVSFLNERKSEQAHIPYSDREISHQIYLQIYASIL